MRLQGNTGVIVIAATNRADILDPALTRPGRFDRQVQLFANCNTECRGIPAHLQNAPHTKWPHQRHTHQHQKFALALTCCLALVQVQVEVPDVQGRWDILKVHAKNKKLAEDVNLESVAMRVPGFSGADLANLLNEAAILTGRKNLPAITNKVRHLLSLANPPCTSCRQSVSPAVSASPASLHEISVRHVLKSSFWVF